MLTRRDLFRTSCAAAAGLTFGSSAGAIEPIQRIGKPIIS